VIATATLARYGAVGWIGMVLVDEAHRGRGLGGEMFRRISACGEGLGVTTLGLDATDQGRPVYLKQQFADHSGIDRWSGSGGGSHGVDGPAHVRGLREDDWPAALALDALASGTDRAALLRTLASEPSARALVIENDDGLAALGLARIGRVASMIGPVIARSDEHAVAVTSALLSALTGPVYVDAFRGSALCPLLESRGFTVARRLTRMARPKTNGPLLTGPMLYAAAGFELG